MIWARKFRYWLGYKLLIPHVQREWRDYMFKSSHGDDPKAMINCSYICIGLQYAVSKDRRRASAEAMS